MTHLCTIPGKKQVIDFSNFIMKSLMVPMVEISAENYMMENNNKMTLKHNFHSFRVR